MEKKISKMFTRGEVNSFNEESKTLELIWATDRPYHRSGWFDSYIEILSLDTASVRLERLNKGAPLLDSHFGWGLKSQIGVVESAFVDGHKGIAKVRFSDCPEIASIVENVKNGIIKNVSVGYRVYKYKDISKDEDRVKTYRAIDWEPMEISLVSIPADPDAQIKKEEEFFNVIIEEREIMPPLEEENDLDDPNIKELQTKAILEERKRIETITLLTRKAGLPCEFSDSLVKENLTLDCVRERILNELIEKGKLTQIKNNVVEFSGLDETVTRRDAMELVLLNRMNASKYKINEPAKKYYGRSLVELARMTLEWQGIKAENLGRNEIVMRALHSTSDFPNILSNFSNKTLHDGYQSTVQTFLPFVKFVSAVDFKPMYRAQLGETPQLEKVNENGEFKYGTIKEGSESYKLMTYGKSIGITRQAIIDDDLGAFSRISYGFGLQAANLESDLFWGIITKNLVMGDGVVLFHANHNNLASSGAAISVNTISDARVAMMTQKGLDGQTIVNVTSTHLVVPAKLLTTAQQNTTAILGQTATKVADVNPFAGQLIPIGEPRLDRNSLISWYVFSMSSLIDMVEFATLDGNRGPETITENGFDFDGFRMRAFYDIGAAAIDYRGFYKNPGA